MYTTPKSNRPSDNLFIGDLPASTTLQELQAVFGQYGTIISIKVNTPYGPKGSALIRFSTVEEASWVAENLNGNIPQGLSYPVVALFANQGVNIGTSHMGINHTSNGSANGGNFLGQSVGQKISAQPPEGILIGDIPQHIESEDQIKELFAPYCAITTLSAQEAQWLVENLNGNIPQGLVEPITVRYTQQGCIEGVGGAGGNNFMGGPGQTNKYGLQKPPKSVPTPSEHVMIADLPEHWEKPAQRSVRSLRNDHLVQDAYGQSREEICFSLVFGLAGGAMVGR